MRWERLFAELEAQADEAELIEREALARELIDEDWRATSWVELLTGEVELEIAAIGRIRGRIARRGATMLGLETGVSAMLVPVHAVRQLVVASGRPSALSVLEQRLGWARVLRILRDDAEPVEVVDLDGRQIAGVVDVVGADFVALRTRAGRRVVSWSAVAAIRMTR